MRGLCELRGESFVEKVAIMEVSGGWETSEANRALRVQSQFNQLPGRTCITAYLHKLLARPNAATGELEINVLAR